MELNKIKYYNNIINNKDKYYILNNYKIKIFFSFIIYYLILKNFKFYNKSINGNIVKLMKHFEVNY